MPVKVSVIIPAYQTAAFIGETLNSVFAQTESDFEVIVVNDGSPDTDELERAIAPYRGRIAYLAQENRGPAGARNTAIRQAQGKYAAFLDSDDCWLPEYLASQIKILEDAPALDAVYCDARYFGDSDFAAKTFMQMFPSNGPVTLQTLLGKECTVITSCTLVLKQAVMDAGLFDEAANLRGCEDFDLWLRILHRGGRISYQKKALGQYRSRTGSLSQDAMKMSKAVIAVYEKAERTMDLPKETRAILEKQIKQAQAYIDLESGRNYLSAGDFRRAKDALAKANSFFHRPKLKAAILGLQLAPRWTRSAVQTWRKAIASRE